MRVPVSIPVGGYAIEIEYVDELFDEKNEAIAAETLPLENKIRVNKGAKTNDTWPKLFSTLFHELQHVAHELTGHAEWLGEKREESVVYGTEFMLAPVLDFKPHPGIKWKQIKFPSEK